METVPIAEIPFVDGSRLAVYVDREGRQYVLDGEKQPVCGSWIHPDQDQDQVPDVPVVVESII